MLRDCFSAALPPFCLRIRGRAAAGLFHRAGRLPHRGGRLPGAGRFFCRDLAESAHRALDHLPTASRAGGGRGRPTGGLLLAGPPGSGKTTLLRSIVQRLCESDSLVSVIDERGELMACETGSLPRAAQIRCDVYARCTKPEGIAMALRCMNPQILVCDELGTAEDAQAVAQGVASGVVFLQLYTAIPRRVYIKAPAGRTAGHRRLCKSRLFVRACPSRHRGTVGHTLTVLLHAAGGMLLLCAGMGFGFTAAAHIRDCQRQLHSLSRLFGYLAELLNAQALAGPAFAPRSALPGICRLLPGGCCSSGRPAASILPARRPCGVKPLQTLRSAEESPRLTACAALHRLAALCEEEACSRAEQYRAAGCFGPGWGLSGRTDRHFAVVRSGLMDIDLVFKIAATGIIVAVLNQLLIRSGREDQAMMTTLAGLIVVLTMLVRQISDLFVLIKALFEL